jgi:hypothetical protein
MQKFQRYWQVISIPLETRKFKDEVRKELFWSSMISLYNQKVTCWFHWPAFDQWWIRCSIYFLYFLPNAKLFLSRCINISLLALVHLGKKLSYVVNPQQCRHQPNKGPQGTRGFTKASWVLLSQPFDSAINYTNSWFTTKVKYNCEGLLTFTCMRCLPPVAIACKKNCWWSS